MTGQMGNEPLISVIVPIYKVEEYLPYCMESILAQSYGNLEIILVDDGSPDKSGAMAEEYAKKDRRVKCFHKENGGPSDARNFGLAHMTGEYVTFVDSDDYVRLDYVETLYRKLTSDNSEMAVCAVRKTSRMEDCNVDNSSNQESVCYNQKEVMELMLARKIPMYVAGKLFVSSLFDEIRFPTGRLFEDFYTTWRVLGLVKKVSIISSVLYFYRQHSSSIVNTEYKPQRLDQLYFAEDVLKEQKVGSRLYYIVQSRCFFAACDNLTYVTSEYPDDVKYIKAAIKKYRGGVLRDGTAEVKMKFMSLVSYVSIGLVKKIGLFYKKHNEKKFAK